MLNDKPLRGGRRVPVIVYLRCFLATQSLRMLPVFNTLVQL
jgi:hypothetical protein